MKKYRLMMALVAGLSLFASCSDWLEVYPQDDQVSDYYWTSKEEVDAVLNAGYVYMKDMVEPQLIPLGELRGSCIYSRSGNNLQSFR